MIYVLGGGANLNFKVVGGTSAPSNPKENTVWVNTDTDITGWEFSPATPTSPVEGLVWIQTGSSGTMSFNALKKNAIKLFPLNAKQYVGGAWVTKIGKGYQGGNWVDWILYIFKDGVTSVDVGEWVGSSTIAAQSNYAAVPPTYTINNGALVITQKAAGGSTGALISENLIDVTNFSTLKFVVTANRCNSGDANGFGLIPAGSTLFNQAVAKQELGNNKTGTLYVDISNVSGAYHIAVMLESWSNTCNTTITEIVIE